MQLPRWQKARFLHCPMQIQCVVVNQPWLWVVGGGAQHVGGADGKTERAMMCRSGRCRFGPLNKTTHAAPVDLNAVYANTLLKMR